MKTRSLGPFQVAEIGLGCMNLSHAYGTPPPRDRAARLLLEALDLGYTLFDTAALYGFGANEALLGNVLGKHRSEITLTSKCGMFKNSAGERTIDGRPETLRSTCEESLKRLQTDRIDLYYLHRWDRRVPIEESVGALADLAREGKILSIGLSEVSADTLRRAHREHPVTALQSEYSLFTRNTEIAVLDACRELNVSFVAFSPLSRGLLGGEWRDPSRLEEGDLRRQLPRFRADNLSANQPLLDQLITIASEQGCTLAQLSLAWLLARWEGVIPIPGTTDLVHLEENTQASGVRLKQDLVDRLDRLCDHTRVQGERYSPRIQAEVDTEIF